MEPQNFRLLVRCFPIKLLERSIEKSFCKNMRHLKPGLPAKRGSKKSSARQGAGSYSRSTTFISPVNKYEAKTFIEYDFDETLEIKEEILQDSETIKVQKRNQSNKSKFCTVYIKEDDILDLKPKTQTPKKQRIKKPEQGKKHTCNTCARTYKLKQTLNFHQKFECGVIPQFSCEFCHKQFTQKCSMNRHIGHFHRKPSVTKAVLMYKCDKCSRSYTSLYSLNQHKRIEHGAVKPQFFCDVCGYKSNQKSNLSKHITFLHTQSPKTSYKCDKCTRSYKSSDSLNRHKRLEHSAVKTRFICDCCNYQSNLKCSLSKHITSRHPQTSETRYKCDKCSRSYRSLNSLNQHKRLEHAAVITRFTCDYCKHQTNLKSSLCKHITARHLK
ncbi:zinc finger protein 765-like [Belonocnema kinseyi]|uniref:zinc finger protein 765-like n=1 Tax=Belonocnema kinseyi TaxID=2817044 RepID=UPI00143DD270|nr:zinc finger protein 765-like [Belonocnema kinseyi]